MRRRFAKKWLKKVKGLRSALHTLKSIILKFLYRSKTKLFKEEALCCLSIIF